jgi:pyruvate dehydrogenase E2 component (dihydrolipoamide acetyltransferase)
MPTPILMPALSPTMEQGKLAKWLVKEGDKVSSGDAIAEIETDKATMEVEAVDEGTIGKIMIAEGTDGVAVNTPIAMLLAEDEDAAALKGYGAEPAQPAPGQASQAGMQPVAHPHPHGATAGDDSPAHAKNGHAAGDRIFASPLARRLAAQAGIALSQVRGSGPRGRIVKHDVEAARAAPPISVAAAAAGAQPTQALTIARNGLPQPLTDEQILGFYEPGTYEVQPHDNMRKTIAQRLTQAKVTVPHFYLSIDCELDALLAARARLNERSPKDGPGAYKLSVNDFIIKAMGLALQRVPKANATWSERGMLLHKRSDVAVAVAVEGGLFTPVLRDVEHKTLAQLSHEMKDLAERARRRRLAPHEYQGGTTAISNLGMFGIRRFDAVINPPHATILAVGAGEQRPVVRSGKVEVATMMSCTLSCDHRVVDGALGAELLAAFNGFIEEPVTMLV